MAVSNRMECSARIYRTYSKVHSSTGRLTAQVLFSVGRDRYMEPNSKSIKVDALQVLQMATLLPNLYVKRVSSVQLGATFAYLQVKTQEEITCNLHNSQHS